MDKPWIRKGMNLGFDVTAYRVGGMRKGQELNTTAAGVGTGRSVLDGPPIESETREGVFVPPLEQDRTVFDMDFSEVEMRVLAHMRQDAEKMDATDEFRRPEDLDGYDTAKVRTLLSLKDAEKILNEEGCQKVQTHENFAAEMFGVDEADVTPEQRTFVKNYRFAEMYSADPAKLNELVQQAVDRSRKEIG